MCTCFIEKAEQKGNIVREQGHPICNFDLLKSQSQKQNQEVEIGKSYQAVCIWIRNNAVVRLVHKSVEAD
jgi:hypothetical protein